MTNSTLKGDNSARTYGTATAVRPPQTDAGATTSSSNQPRFIEAMKSQYQVDQQVKFLHLQADADSLLEQLKAIKQQRQAAIS